MVIQQGDVYWVDLGDPVGSAPGFLHPHVVVQNVDKSQLDEKIGTLPSRRVRQILDGLQLLLELYEFDILD